VLFPASGQAGGAGPAVRKAHRENRCQTGENEQAHFSGLLPVFFCPEARLATSKLQAQIVCYCVQAGSPAGFFAAFFPGKKARILPAKFRFAALPLPKHEKRNPWRTAAFII